MLKRRVSLPVWLLSLVLVAVAALAATGGWWATARRTSPTFKLRGVVNGVSQDGRAFAFRADGEPGTGGTGYLYGGSLWTDSHGGRHAGDMPACLVPSSTRERRVELGVVDVRGRAWGGDGSQIVAWIHCLDDDADA
jgi:hypothetical protein